MDELYAVALEEIALEGRRGCSLSLLWQLLEPRLPGGLPQLTSPLKQVLWRLFRCESSGLTYSTIELQAQAREAARHPGPQGRMKKKKKKKKGEDEDEEEQPQIETEIPSEVVPEDVWQAEEAGVVVVAPVAARLAVVGVYEELEASHKLSEHQLAVLEMVGQRRYHGAVQTDMANELGVQHRNFFYVLKMLEARHMIVRNKLMVPMSGSASNGGWSITSIVHLPRYAPKVVLGAEAVFKEVQTAQGQQLQQQAVQQQGEGSSNYVVRDDATVMQQICHFLGKQNGRYVSESQVKAVLGFTGSPTAHRQWRRLRTRLIKLGCIKAELGMIDGRAISVLRLVKPFKLKLLVVVNSDEEQQEADGGDEGDEGDEPAYKASAAADEAADDEAEAAQGGDGTAANGSSKVPVEVGREQLMLELLCEAGSEGMLTPELSKKIGAAPKVMLRSLPELCKKYGLKVEYDMPNKALTNRLIAPEHLQEKYNQQKHLLGSTPAATAVQQRSAPPPAQEQQQAAAAGGEQQGPAAAAMSEVAMTADQDSEQQQQQQQQQQQETVSTDAGTGASVSGRKISAAEESAVPGAVVRVVPADATAAGNRQDVDKRTALAAVTTTGERSAAGMDVDDTLEEALDAVLRQSAAAAADNAPSAVMHESAAACRNDMSAAAAAGGGSRPSVGGTGGQGTTTAAVTVRNVRGPARRLAGLSTYQSAAHASGSTAALLAQGAMYRVRAVSGPTAVSAAANQQQAAAQLASAAGTTGSFGTQSGVSRLQQRRLQVLKDHLQEAGFMMKQELRRLIMNSEVQPASQQRPHNLYDYTGPDTKTCNRLHSLLVESGVARLVKLQYHQEAVLEPKEVEVLLHKDVEQTPELLQRIAIYDAELPGNLRREGMRRALLAQGLVGKAAARAAAAEAGSGQVAKGGFAGLGLLIASEQVQLLPVATNLRSLPGYGIRNSGAGDSAGGGGGGSRRRGGGKPRGKKRASAVESGAADSGAATGAEDAADGAQAGAGEGEAAPAATTGSQQATANAKAVKGQEIQQLHRNGYVPTLMLRAKMLHQYLCACVHLKTEPHEDMPQMQMGEATGAHGQHYAAITAPGYEPSSRGSKAQWLRFVLAGRQQEEQQQRQSKDAGVLVDQQDVGYSAGLFQLSRPARALADGVGAAVSEAATATEAATVADNTEKEPVPEDGVAGSCLEDDDAKRQELERQLGGRLLHIERLWLHMPLTVALCVAGTHLRVSNLLDLLSQTPPPTVSSFDPSQREEVFGPKAWKRVVGTLAVLTKLKLITPAKRGQGPELSWTQCHPTKATHLVIGTVGVLDEPTQGADVAPACLRFDFTNQGQWSEYWTKMQSLYDTTLFTQAQLQRFFPASSLPDVARHRCWVSYRDMSVVPFLRLQLRLHGLPVEQLDMHMARQVSEELGLPYAQVHPFVTRLRTEINEQREKAGLERIYLLSNRLESGATEAGRKKGSGSADATAKREKRRRRHMKRRLKRLKRQQQEGVSLADGGLAAAAPGSESDTEYEEDQSDTDEGEAAAEKTGGQLDHEAVTAGLPPRPRQPSARKQDRQRKRTSAEGASAGGDSVSSSDSDGSADGRQQRRTSTVGGKHLPKIIIQVVPEAAAAVDSSAAAGGEGVTAAAAGGSEVSDSDGAGRRAASLHGTAATDAGGDRGDVVDAPGTEGVPARIAGKRHRWTPQQDRQLLKWVVQQRVELGTRVQVRWSHAAPGLPLRVDLCTRRFNFLKKNKASSKFLASLEAQAIELHREYSKRRMALQQHLSRIQQENRLSVNPILLQRQQSQPENIPADQLTAEHGRLDQQQRQQQPLLVPAGYDPPLQPLPGGQQQQQQGQSASTGAVSGGPGTAAALLAVAGPHEVTAQGNIILLPTDSIKVKYSKLIEQIDEFTTPRQQQAINNRERRAAAAAAQAGGAGLMVLHRQQQRRRRRQGAMSDYEQGKYDDASGHGDSDVGISSGDSDVEDEWVLLTNAAGAAAAPGQQRLGGTQGPKRARGSRQVRPLKTVSDRVAHTNALLAASAAAAAAVIAKRRAAGEQIDQDAEERERQLQLQAHIEGHRKRRSKQRKHLGPAISNPRDLIHSWRLHHVGVETPPAAAAAATAKNQQPAAVTAEGDKVADEGLQDNALAAAVAEGELPDYAPAAVAMETSAPKEPGAGGDVAEAALGSSAAAAAVSVSSWSLGPAPSTPVMTAMHLITSLMYLVADAGSLPSDASVALLLRFSQAEVAAAFRWLRALGWLNSGASRRPFQLSSTWHKRMRGEGVLADLLDRTPAAQFALRKIGLLTSGGTAAGERQSVEAAINAADVDPVVNDGAVSDRVSQQLLAGLQRLERDTTRAAEVKEKQKGRQEQQQQSQQCQQKQDAQCDKGMDVDQQAKVQQGRQQQQQQDDVTGVDLDGKGEAAAKSQEQDQAVSAVGPPPAAAETDQHATEPITEDDMEQQQNQDLILAAGQQEEFTAAATPSTPKAVVSCLSALHSAADASSQGDDSRASRCFWVGMQPSTPSGTAEIPAAGDGAAAAGDGGPKAVSVPGSLLLEVILLAAAGDVCLTLCTKPQQSRGSGRAAARGEAAALSQKTPQLLVQLASPAPAAQQPDQQVPATEAGTEVKASVAAGAPDTSAGDKVLLIPRSAVNTSANLLAYCGHDRYTNTSDFGISAPGTPELAGGAGSATFGRKRPREVVPELRASMHKPLFSALEVGRNAANRQAAEDACYATASALETPGPSCDDSSGSGAGNDPVDSSTRPVKRQKVSEPGVGVVGSRNSSSCPPKLVHALLLAVRDAGSQGLSTTQLLRQYQQAADTSADHMSAARGGLETTVGNLDGRDLAVVDSVHQSAATVVATPLAAGVAAVSDMDVAAAADRVMQQSETAATEPSAQAQASEGGNAFAVLPAGQRVMSGAAADAALVSGMSLLHRFGLIRRVAGWQDHVWLAAEHSDRLLAWPLTEHKQQEQQQVVLSMQQRQQDETETATKSDLLQQQQQQQPSAGTTKVTEQHTQDANDNGTSVAVTVAVDDVAKDAAHCNGDSSNDQGRTDQTSGSSTSGVLVMPWLDHRGRLNSKLWQSLVKRIMGVVLRNPGIPESLLVGQLDMVSPAAAKEAINILLQNQHLVARSDVSPGHVGGDQATRSQTVASTRHSDAAGRHDSSTVAAKKLSNTAGSNGYSGWDGGAVALRLGAGLTSYTPTPSQPPSLLVGRNKLRDHSVVAGDLIENQREVLFSKQPRVVHYWPSLKTSTTCHLTCVPPCMA